MSEGRPTLTNQDQVQDSEQRAADGLRLLLDALPEGTQTSLIAFRPEINGQRAGAVKALVMADTVDDLRCAQWIIERGVAGRATEGGSERSSEERPAFALSVVRSSGAMAVLWAVAIVLGLAYLLMFDVAPPTFAFVVGQVMLGGIGLTREWQIRKTTGEER